MQAISSITMYTDNEGQQETVSWGGKKTRQGKETWRVCVFVKNIVIFLLRKDKAIKVKQFAKKCCKIVCSSSIFLHYLVQTDDKPLTSLSGFGSQVHPDDGVI